MKYIPAIFIFLLSISSCQPKTEVKETSLPNGPYFSQTADTTAQLFAPGIVSKSYPELNSVFSSVHCLNFTISNLRRKYSDTFHAKRLLEKKLFIQRLNFFRQCTSRSMYAIIK